MGCGYQHSLSIAEPEIPPVLDDRGADNWRPEPPAITRSSKSSDGMSIVYQ